MAMTDRDRKKLWGQAAGTCSLCRKFLIQDAGHPADREALIGEEAHIISESRNGPRGLNSVPGMDFDTYHNRILLCRIHHRVIDEQPHQYSVEELREIKAQHEKWVRDRLHDLPEELGNAPIGLKPRYPSRGMLLPRLRSGKDAWLAAIGPAFYLLEPVDEDEASTEACDAADQFLSNLKEYAEAHDIITDGGFGSIRQVQRELRQGLDELASHRLVVFAAQRDMLLTGGVGAPSPCTMAVAVIRPQDEVGDDGEIAVAFPGKDCQ